MIQCEKYRGHFVVISITRQNIERDYSLIVLTVRREDFETTTFFNLNILGNYAGIFFFVCGRNVKEYTQARERHTRAFRIEDEESNEANRTPQVTMTLISIRISYQLVDLHFARFSDRRSFAHTHKIEQKKRTSRL